MKKRYTLLVALIVVLVFMLSLNILAQQRQRAPWEERSPKVGKTVPDVNIYDANLNPIKISNLYKGTHLYFQWGGCT